MYIPTHPVMLSQVTREDGGAAKYELWPSNGSLVRTPRGAKVARDKNKPLKILYRCDTNGDMIYGSISDRVLVERIMEYMAEYHGKRWTNCAAFAHFLTTGKFVECSRENMFILEQGMRVYHGQKVDVGDMICVIYAHDEYCRSRKTRWRNTYLKAKKGRRREGGFGHILNASHEVYTAAEVREISQSPLTRDFHFLVCAAKHNGKPVWISQRGHYNAGEASVPVALTTGEDDGYYHEIPFLTFIKKRR